MFPLLHALSTKQYQIMAFEPDFTDICHQLLHSFDAISLMFIDAYHKTHLFMESASFKMMKYQDIANEYR